MIISILLYVLHPFYITPLTSVTVLCFNQNSLEKSNHSLRFCWLCDENYIVKVNWQYLTCKFPWNIDLDVILIWNEWHSLFNKYLQMHKNRKRHLLIIPPSLLHSSLEGSNEVNDITSTFGSSHRMHSVSQPATCLLFVAHATYN